MSICIYYSYLNKEAYSSLEALFPLLPSARRRQLADIRHPLHRAQSIAVTALLVYGLTCFDETSEILPPISVDTKQLCAEEGRRLLKGLSCGWVTGDSGQPFPNGIPYKEKRRFVSLSHSGTIAAAALSDRPVGLDVQTDEPVNAAALFRRLSHPDEAMGEENGGTDFLRWWTCKEAAVKLTGEGLSRPFSSFAILPGDAGGCFYTALDSHRVGLRSFPIGDGVATAAFWEKNAGC